MDGIGVILSPRDDGKFDVYRVKLVDEKVTELDPVTGGEGRAKSSAMRVAERELIAISQAFTRNQVEFGELEDE